MTLSKSQYIRGLQCHKSLWLYKHKPELRDTPSAQTESSFNTGYDVGELAKELFPNGVEIAFDSSNFDGMIAKTKELIDGGCEVIYEATFKGDGIFAMADILVKNGKSWDIYEVKASTHTKEYHKNDTAIQWYALSKAINLNRAYIIHINNKYVRDGELNIQELFTIDDITDIVLQKQGGIEPQLLEMQEMLKADGMEFGGVHLAYQSKVGPMKWLEPSLDDTLKGMNGKNVVIFPIAFTMDNSETDYELEVEYKEIAKELGVGEFRVCRCPNDSDLFVDALMQIYEKMR